jgi:excisionase family DNA binding protein
MAHPTPRWGTMNQAAEEYGVSRRTIQRWLADGTLVGRRIGKAAVRVRLDDIGDLGKPITFLAAS